MLHQFIEQLEKARKELGELEGRLADPAVSGGLPRYRELARRQAELSELLGLYDRYQQAERQVRTTEEMLRQGDLDEATAEMARGELEELHGEVGSLASELRRRLLPRDPNWDRNAIVEIRAGTGGEEAALFAADLCRMYTRFAERKGWKLQALDASPTGLGGYKEVTLAVEGKGAYGLLSFESGVHRVQRVPVTEASGRMHTSAASVAVLAEAEEVDAKIEANDLRTDTFRAGGPGGQHMQKNETGVRITHVPTGLVAQCSDERSQLQNKVKAMRWLRARLLEQKMAEQEQEIAATRRAQIKTGDRSEKIRTYNFPQNRVTDHRINYTTHNLEQILDGELEDLLQHLQQADEEQRIAQMLSSSPA
jgi:peptide chain release factor 1